MKLSLDKYFDGQNAGDLQVISPVAGFSDAAVEMLAGLDGVADVSRARIGEAYMEINAGRYFMRVHNIPDGEGAVNKALVTEGRLPENENECLVDGRFCLKQNIKIGDTVKLSAAAQAMLTAPELTVTGKSGSPLYVADNNGNGFGGDAISSYIYVADSAFRIGGGWVDGAFLTLDACAGLSRFGDKYAAAADSGAETVKTAVAAYLGGMLAAMPPEARPPAGTDVSGLFKVLDLKSNYGFAQFSGDCDRIAAISRIFPFIFFLVAVLMAFTNIVRLIEGERGIIGVMRSLGYGRTAVYMRYAVYAASSGLPAGVLGIALGFWFFPRVIFGGGYQILYALPAFYTPLNIGLSLLALGIALLSVLIPTLLTGMRGVRAVPAELMRPKAPLAGKRIILERMPFIWKRTSFPMKVTSRNIMRGYKKSTMTIVGIAGCTALILAGFGLDNSIKDITARHFGVLNLFEYKVELEKSAPAAALKEIEDTIDGSGVSDAFTEYHTAPFTAEKDGKTLSLYLIVPEDESAFSEYIVFRDINRRNKFGFVSGKVIITQKMGYMLGLKIGDTLVLHDAESDVRREAVVGGITENYAGHYVYMPAELYRDIFGEQARSNVIVGKLLPHTAIQEESLSASVMSRDGTGSFSFMSTIRAYYGDVTDSLRIIVLVLIMSGALLALVVLFSLTGMNIDERNRELATLKVIGFYDKEASGYVFRENVILTVIGIGLGLIFGIFLHKFIVATAEVDIIMFGKSIHALSYLYAAGLSFAFMLAVNLFMNRTVKKIDMIEALKSTE
jgi:putative ABC transport system permease protein